MTPALIVDGLIVVAVLLALLSGWRNGALAAVLASIGVGAGVVLGIAVAPAALRLVDQPSLRLLLLVGILVLFVGIGQLIGSSLGGSVRDRMKARTTQRLDSAVGAVFQAFAALVVIWLISIPVATNLGGATGQGLRDSRILGNLNSAAPARVAALPNGVAAMLNESGLPPLVSPWQNSISNEEVKEPDPDVQDPELVRRMRPLAPFCTLSSRPSPVRLPAAITPPVKLPQPTRQEICHDHHTPLLHAPCGDLRAYRDQAREHQRPDRHLQGVCRGAREERPRQAAR